MALKSRRTKLSEGYWINNSQTENTAICIRPKTWFCRYDILKQAQVIFTDQDDKVKTRTDNKLYDEAEMDYVIVDWKDVTDEDHNPLPCIRENKIRIMNEFPTIWSYLSELSEKIAIHESEETELLKKT